MCSQVSHTPPSACRRMTVHHKPKAWHAYRVITHNTPYTCYVGCFNAIRALHHVLCNLQAAKVPLTSPFGHGEGKHEWRSRVTDHPATP